MLTGFEYNYKSSSEIMSNIEAIASFNQLELSILAVIIIVSGIGVYYVFPLLHIIKKYGDRQREKAKRKIMLKQISMQRTIEDEIENEIEETSKLNAQK